MSPPRSVKLFTRHFSIDIFPLGDKQSQIFAVSKSEVFSTGTRRGDEEREEMGERAIKTSGSSTREIDRDRNGRIDSRNARDINEAGHTSRTVGGTGTEGM